MVQLVAQRLPAYGFNSGTTLSSMCAKSSNSAHKIDLVGDARPQLSSVHVLAMPDRYKPVGW